MTQTPAPPRHSFRKFAPLVPLLVAAGVALTVRYWPRHTPAGIIGETPGTKAPDFALPDPKNPAAPPVQLSKLLANGPVAIYFVPTYGCKKCLTFMEKLSPRLPELKAAGLQFVGVCPMSVEALKGEFDVAGVPPIPLLSDFLDADHWNQTAIAFGITNSPCGIVIVDREGRIQFTNQDDDPFDDFDKLAEIAHTLQPNP